MKGRNTKRSAEEEKLAAINLSAISFFYNKLTGIWNLKRAKPDAENKELADSVETIKKLCACGNLGVLTSQKAASSRHLRDPTSPIGVERSFAIAKWSIKMAHDLFPAWAIVSHSDEADLERRQGFRV